MSEQNTLICKIWLEAARGCQHSVKYIFASETGAKCKGYFNHLKNINNTIETVQVKF